MDQQDRTGHACLQLLWFRHQGLSWRVFLATSMERKQNTQRVKLSYGEGDGRHLPWLSGSSQIRTEKKLQFSSQQSRSASIAPAFSYVSRTFFFLWFGRSRSKARSLLETKLLIRKQLHGRRWSHEAWQIITRKTTNTPTNKNTARRRSPSQTCVLPFERQQSKQPTGPEPNKKNHKRFAKDTVVKTHCVTIKTKTCSKRIMPPKNVRHANYVVASKATRSRVYYTL